MTSKPLREFLFGLAPFSLTITPLLSNNTDASHPYNSNQHAQKKKKNRKKKISGCAIYLMLNGVLIADVTCTKQS